MGTRKKLVLASLVSTMMVLACLIGLLPSQDAVDISASSGRLEMKELIDAILSDKLIGDIVVKSPIVGSRTFVVNYQNPYAQIPVMLEPGVVAEDGDTVTYVASMDESVAFQEPFNWDGEVFSDAVGDPFVGKLDIGPLLTGAVTAEATNIYLRALVNAVPQLKATSLMYEDTSSNALVLSLLEKDLDSDGNGFPDNFLNIAPGQLWQGKNTAGNRIVAVQNLSAGNPAKQVANIELQIADTDLSVPATEELISAGAVPVGESAYLMVQISDSPVNLIDAFQTGSGLTTDAGAIQAWGDSVVAAQPGALSTMAQYVDISIVYTVDGGSSYQEIDSLENTDLGVDITFTGLDLSNTIENPQVWSFPTLIENLGGGNIGVTNDVSVTDEWKLVDGEPIISRSEGSVAALDVQTFSIFANLNTGIGLASIVPSQAPNQTATDVVITGLTQNQAAINVVTAAANYRVLFGTTEGVFRDGTEGGDVAITAPVDGVNTIYVTAPALDPGVYDVRFENISNPSLFAVLEQAFTVSAVYTLNVNLTDSTTAQNLSTAVNPTSGQGLDAGSYFDGDTPEISLVNFDPNVHTAVWTVNGQPTTAALADGTLTVDISEDTVVNVEVYDTPDVFMLTVNLTDNTTAANLAVNLSPASGMGLADGEFFDGDMVTVTLLNFNAADQSVVWTINGVESSATDSLVVTMDQNYTINIVAEDITDPGLLPTTITSITPVNAPVFGGVVAQITGTNLTETTTITIGGKQVQGFRPSEDNTTIEVIIPASADTSDANTVLADVTVQNAENPAATLVDGFMYKRYYAAGGSIQTAKTIPASGATIDVALGDPSDRSGELVIPALSVAKPGNANVHVIVRTAPSVAAKQNTETLGTEVLDTILAGAAGSPVGGTSNFAFFVYADMAEQNTNTMAKQNTPAVGMPTLAAVQGALSGTPGSNTSAMLLSQPVADGSLTAADVRAGLSFWGIASSFDFTTDVQTTANNAEVAYQSTISKTEVSPQLALSDADETAITDIMMARLYSLNAFTMRSGASMAADVRQGILDNNTGQFEGPVTGGTPLTLVSPLGQLAWVDRIEFTSASGAKQVVATADSGNFTTEPGSDEYQLVLETPEATEAGLTDVSVFLASDPNNAAVTLDGFFQFTEVPSGTPWLLLLGALVALLALFAGGDSGGGGGPCFIATAAYGTPMAAEIDTLRTVRDEYLLTNALGTAFVDTYYQVSPAIADVVAKSPALAALVRVLLMPVVFLGKVAIMAPALATFVAMSLGALFILRRRARNRA